MSLGMARFRALMQLGLYVLVVLFITFPSLLQANELPAISKENGRFVLRVDGKPFLILGVQINNSSAWPATMPKVWSLLDTLPINTMEAPVYWEQMEPQPGVFNFTNVDVLVTQARQHHLRLILCWFGTWKNGKMHYAPEWIKSDSKKYPHVIDEAGQPTDVLTANSTTNLQADTAAFVALMKHLKQIDGEQHTVIMMQVENEPGSLGSVRDHSLEADTAFARGIPAEVAHGMGKQPGSWRQLFGGEADEAFQAYSVAHYIDQVASAGKEIMPLPFYVNVWQRYPFVARSPGVDYPSGGATYNMLDLWKATVHSIDMYAPDIYSESIGTQRKILEEYNRPDNPVWICESGHSPAYASVFNLALGRGAIGVASFGADLTDWHLQSAEELAWLTESFAPILPMAGKVAAWNAANQVKTSVEEPGATRQVLTFGRWNVLVNYGTYKPAHEEEQPSGTAQHDGRVIVVQLASDEFLITGINANVQLEPDPKLAERGQILKAEEGHYENDAWIPLRIWNGDQTDYGMHFQHSPVVLKVRMGTY